MILFLKIVKKSFAYNTLIIGISNGMVAVLLVLIVAGYTAYTHPHTSYRPLNEIILPVIVALLVVGIIETIEGLIVGL